ncbi:MAG: OST-HTH/LOTUS domain-containing protein, partial [Sphingomonadaceae bacterium]|nr:OST-HTH/LOTUS domain-containing protein [Sphingomonadaceae bacterium]
LVAPPVEPVAAGKAPAPKKKPKIDTEVVELLIDALGASKRDERGYASLNEVGQRANNRSSFDARNYGFSRLSDLIEAIPNFATEKREDGRMFVKRLR